MRARRPFLAALAALGVVAVSGCSLLVLKLEPPRLAIESVAVERAGLFTQLLDVRMRVANPNDRELPIRSLEYTLDVEGAEAARGRSTAAFTVPAHGQTDFDMQVTANLAGAILRLLARGGSRGAPIAYHIRGKVRLSHGLLRSIPFDERGTFRLR
ncbi:MAG: LEA type 2 family protein [Steroidobacteraceae bacterium]